MGATQDLNEGAVAKTGMLIRKPVAKVFEAFVDPAITTRFWFTHSSGVLRVGEPVTWTWQMYDASTQVTPMIIEQDRRIVIDWDGYTGRTTVEWRFAPRDDGRTTFVSITESGWTSTGDELIRHVTSATEGFTWTLAGLKGWLEHGIDLNFVPDRFPDGPDDPFPDR
jgi:uncharacterized protein YndB with AHSA1/START domain